MTEHPEIITATIKKFSEMSSLSRTTIYELMDSGALRSVLVGTRRLIIIESYREYLTYLSTYPSKRVAGVRRRTRTNTKPQISLVRND